MGWELFKNYLIAKEKFKPDFFLYENNVSAAQDIKSEIRKRLNVYDGTFLMPYSDVRYIEINSALVSGQNRERFYVHNCGEVRQPKDRGITVSDVLESGLAVRIPEYINADKSRPVLAGYCCKGDGEGSLLDKCFPENPNKQKVDYVAEPVNVTRNGKSHTIKAQYSNSAIANFITNGGYEATGVAEPIHERYNYATEFDSDGNPTKAYCYADGKIHFVYGVKDGKITIDGRDYDIKLPDMFCIIRKLTVAECRRLQTIPDWYKMPCSTTQNYKMLGNVWTIETIKHILSHIPNIATEPIEVLSMYDGMSCGQIALKELGANVVRYYATEIDKYAIQTTQANFPDTVQLGDAFQVRDSKWCA